jgi:hypothetical protein
MKKIALLLAVLALGAVFSESASASGRVVVGVGFGYPGWGYPGWGWGPGPWYYGSPSYYYPPGVVSGSPTTYIERQDVAPKEPASTDWWYYCEESKSYYPYVKTCPTGWQKVSPTPPPG